MVIFGGGRTVLSSSLFVQNYNTSSLCHNFLCAYYNILFISNNSKKKNLGPGANRPSLRSAPGKTINQYRPKLYQINPPASNTILKSICTKPISLFPAPFIAISTWRNKKSRTRTFKDRTKSIILELNRVCDVHYMRNDFGTPTVGTQFPVLSSHRGAPKINILVCQNQFPH